MILNNINLWRDTIAQELFLHSREAPAVVQALLFLLSHIMAVVMAYEYAEVVDAVDGTPAWDVVMQLQDLGYFRVWYPDIYENGIPVNHYRPMKTFFSKLNSMNIYLDFFPTSS